MKRRDGNSLNERYRRGAKQARYREDGTWYHILDRFPADLYDANGVIRFETEEQYFKLVRTGPDPNSTHVEFGISKLPGYTKLDPAPHTLF